MTFTQLSYFVAVVQNESFTKAAEEMFVGQPALSKQIALLEEELGEPLIIRSRRYLGLTEAGELLYKESLALVKKMEEIKQKIQQLSRKRQGSLTVGITGPGAMSGLVSAFSQFVNLHPQVRLSYHQSSFSKMVDSVAAETIDIGLTYNFALSEPDRFCVVPLAKRRLSLILPETHPCAESETVDLFALRDVPFIFCRREDDPVSYDFKLGLCTKSGFVPQIITSEHHSLESQCLMVRSGLGVAIAFSNYTDDHSGVRFCGIRGSQDVELLAVWSKTNRNPMIQCLVELFPVSEDA